MLEVDGVDKRFGGVQALSDVTLSAPVGCITGLIGPNGAGKSTLLSCLSGWVRPDRGSVHLDGHVLTDASPQDAARFGVIRTFQNLQLFDGLSVLENLCLGAYRLGGPGIFGALARTQRVRRERNELVDRAHRVARRLDLEHLTSAATGALPYGVRKYVELGRALMGEPKLLLLDEPAAGLDDHERGRLGDIIAEAATSAAVVLVEHAIELVMSVSQTVVVLDFGHVIAAGAPATVRADERVIAAYLGTRR